MLALLLLACAPHRPPSVGAEPVAPGEAERRALCEAGDAGACIVLVAMLEGEAPSPARVREAIDLSSRFALEHPVAAQAAVLVSNAHPDIATPEERATAWRRLCEGQEFRAGCAVGGWELVADRPDDARALWAKGCELGLGHLCAPASPTDVVPVTLPPGFTKGLEALGASFRMPTGFRVIPTPENPHFDPELAILSDDGKVEVWYGFGDHSYVMDTRDECRDQPGCVSADFLRIEQSMAWTLLANVAQVPADKVAMGAFPSVPVRVEFNAHWGLSGGVVADWPGRPALTLSALHRDPAANLYVLFIFHDLAAIGDLGQNDAQGRAFHSLRFAEPVGLGGTWLR